MGVRVCVCVHLFLEVFLQQCQYAKRKLQKERVCACMFEPELNELSSPHTQTLADLQFQSTLDISVTKSVTSNFVMEKKGQSL